LKHSVNELAKYNTTVTLLLEINRLMLLALEKAATIVLYIRPNFSTQIQPRFLTLPCAQRFNYCYYFLKPIPPAAKIPEVKN